MLLWCWRELQVLFSDSERPCKGVHGGWNPPHTLLSQVLRWGMDEGYLFLIHAQALHSELFPQGLCILKGNFLYRTFVPPKDYTSGSHHRSGAEKWVGLPFLKFSCPGHQVMHPLCISWMSVTQDVPSLSPQNCCALHDAGLMDQAVLPTQVLVIWGQHPSYWRK